MKVISKKFFNVGDLCDSKAPYCLNHDILEGERFNSYSTDNSICVHFKVPKEYLHGKKVYDVDIVFKENFSDYFYTEEEYTNKKRTDLIDKIINDNRY